MQFVTLSLLSALTFSAAQEQNQSGDLSKMFGGKMELLDRHDVGRVMETLSRRCRALICTQALGCQPVMCLPYHHNTVGHYKTKILSEDAGHNCLVWQQKYQCRGYYIQSSKECWIDHPCAGLPQRHLNTLSEESLEDIPSVQE